MISLVKDFEVDTKDVSVSLESLLKRFKASSDNDLHFFLKVLILDKVLRFNIEHLENQLPKRNVLVVRKVLKAIKKVK